MVVVPDVDDSDAKIEPFFCAPVAKVIDDDGSSDDQSETECLSHGVLYAMTVFPAPATVR